MTKDYINVCNRIDERNKRKVLRMTIIGSVMAIVCTVVWG